MAVPVHTPPSSVPLSPHLSGEKLKSQSSVNLRFPVEVADDRSACDGNRPCGLTKINVHLKSGEPVYTFCLCTASEGSAMSYSNVMSLQSPKRTQKPIQFPCMVKENYTLLYVHF